MDKINLRFIDPDGTERLVEVTEGGSVMRAGVDAGIPGIFGNCGGHLSCGTCHGYIDATWLAKLPVQGEHELTMLDGVLDVTAESRLTCQIVVTRALDGMTIRIPPYV